MRLKSFLNLIRITKVNLFVIFLFIFVFSAQDLSVRSVQASIDNPGKEEENVLNRYIPNPIIKVDAVDTSYVLMVEISTQRVFLFRANHTIELIKIYNCTTGKNYGSKEKEGDSRTPEGIYYFEGILEGENLPKMYGMRAYTMDYPNFFDRRERKTGKGIWLHSTDQPERIAGGFDSKGCVVVNDQDITELSKFIKLQETPIIVQNEIGFLERGTILKTQNQMEKLLTRWETAWESRDIEAYMDCYARGFYSSGRSWSGWREYKSKLFSTYQEIQLGLEKTKMWRNGNFAIVEFVQNYRSDQHMDVGRKKLFLEKKGLEWYIIGEEWNAITS